MKQQEIIQSFIEELTQLLDETSTAIDSAFLTEDFISKAEHALVIPNIRREDTQVE
jgi:hypothetical protein